MKMYIMVALVILFASQVTTSQAQDSSHVVKAPRVELNVSALGHLFPFTTIDVYMSASGVYHHQKQSFGASFYLPKIFQGNFRCQCNTYQSDTGYGFMEHGLRLFYGRQIYTGKGKRNPGQLHWRFSYTHLWGKIPYVEIHPDPARGLHTVRNRGIVLSTGLSNYIKVSGALWFNSSLDFGWRVVSNKRYFSFNESLSYLNLYTGAGLSFRF